MTAQIAGFLTRAQLNMRQPRSVNRNITPSRGGVTAHYGGNRQNIKNHEACIRRWRSWQDYHMDGHGWSDLAYTGGYCDHGYAFAGRGVGYRTAANGTDAGNQSWYAVTWIGGEGETPTRAALDALEWWVRELRAEGGAGNRVNSHRDHKPTNCGGDPITAHVRKLDCKSIPLPKPPPAIKPPAPEDEMTPADFDKIRALVREEIERSWTEPVAIGRADLRKMLGRPTMSRREQFERGLTWARDANRRALNLATHFGLKD